MGDDYAAFSTVIEGIAEPCGNGEPAFLIDGMDAEAPEHLPTFFTQVTLYTTFPHLQA